MVGVIVNSSNRWPTLHADEPPPKPPLNYATNFNKVEDKITMPIPFKDITSIHGDPTVLWEEEEPECKEGFLSDRHILIRLTNMKDYVHVMSKSTYFLKAKDQYNIRCDL
ncbi:hypothetical protein H5410_021967 [Solanum commersonii]|uniref:Uncharacterized protein n=1 Tax=Solanum commersonii TaxID=4109 RepID=A0A9J5ZII6_SOLCO|nr:hypothetical protein H5410_021967 [Solanum commersonii]